MRQSLGTYSQMAVALVMLFSASGCLTTGVIDKAYDRYPTHANIKQVKEAATLDEHLYLLLDLESEKFKSSSTVLLKIPLRDIGAGRSSVGASSLAHDGLQLRAPYVGIFEATTTLPAEAAPLSIQHVPNDPTKAPNDLELRVPKILAASFPEILAG